MLEDQGSWAFDHWLSPSCHSSGLDMIVLPLLSDTVQGKSSLPQHTYNMAKILAAALFLLGLLGASAQQVKRYHVLYISPLEHTTRAAASNHEFVHIMR